MQPDGWAVMQPSSEAVMQPDGLAVTQPSSEAARRTGALSTRKLARLLDGDDDQAAFAARQLNALAGSSESMRDAINRVGAVFRLLDILTRCSTLDEPASAWLCVDAVQCLSQLAGNNLFCRARIVKLGALAPLVRMLTSTSSERCEAAAYCLSTLVYDDGRHSREIVDAGAIPPLVHLLSSSGGPCEAAVCCLRNLALGGVEADIVAAGAVPRLVRLLTGSTPTALHNTLVCLVALADHSDEHRSAIVAAGAVPVLVRLLTGSTPVDADEAARCLATLAAGRSEHRSAIIAAGAIPVLVRLLISGAHDEVHYAAECLANLTDGCDEHRAAVGAALVASNVTDSPELASYADQEHLSKLMGCMPLVLNLQV